MEIVKQLRLRPPEHANHLGIPAECPVFVSPVLSGSAQCHLCPPGRPTAWDYQPLVYGHGTEVRAQHLHVPERAGGIYCFKTSVGPISGTCWSALGESHAPQWESSPVLGATAVTLWQWLAECYRCRRRLASGELVWDWMELHPLCPGCKPGRFMPAPWRFTIGSDGACHFSQAPQAQAHLPALFPEAPSEDRARR